MGFKQRASSLTVPEIQLLSLTESHDGRTLSLCNPWNGAARGTEGLKSTFSRHIHVRVSSCPARERQLRPWGDRGRGGHCYSSCFSSSLQLDGPKLQLPEPEQKPKTTPNPPGPSVGTSGCGAAVTCWMGFVGRDVSVQPFGLFPLGFSRCLFLIVLALGGNNSAGCKSCSLRVKSCAHHSCVWRGLGSLQALTPSTAQWRKRLHKVLSKYGVFPLYWCYCAQS